VSMEQDWMRSNDDACYALIINDDGLACWQLIACDQYEIKPSVQHHSRLRSARRRLK
jgi:hypothetical protein